MGNYIGIYVVYNILDLGIVHQTLFSDSMGHSWGRWGHWSPTFEQLLLPGEISLRTPRLWAPFRGSNHQSSAVNGKMNDLTHLLGGKSLVEARHSSGQLLETLSGNISNASAFQGLWCSQETTLGMSSNILAWRRGSSLQKKWNTGLESSRGFWVWILQTRSWTWWKS